MIFIGTLSHSDGNASNKFEFSVSLSQLGDVAINISCLRAVSRHGCSPERSYDTSARRKSWVLMSTKEIKEIGKLAANSSLGARSTYHHYLLLLLNYHRDFRVRGCEKPLFMFYHFHLITIFHLVCYFKQNSLFIFQNSTQIQYPLVLQPRSWWDSENNFDLCIFVLADDGRHV